MKKLIALFLCLTLAVGFAACANTSADSPSGDGSSVESGVFSVDVAGVKLICPSDWEGKVDAQLSDDEVTFTAGDEKLFTLLFNRADEGSLLGVVCGEENTSISVVEYDLPVEESELLSLREGLDVILQHLAEDYDFVADEHAAVYQIETPLVTLRYPLKWKDRVTVDVSTEKVSFSDNGTALFDIVFSECDGDLLGTYNGTPIYLVGYTVETQDQLDMQEDVNVILDYLSKDEAFE